MEIKGKINMQEASIGDILIVVHKSDHTIPYVIASVNGGTTLVNLDSGYGSTYVGKDINECIDLYLKNNFSSVKHFFFVKSYNCTLHLDDAFGHSKPVLKDIYADTIEKFDLHLHTQKCKGMIEE